MSAVAPPATEAAAIPPSKAGTRGLPSLLARLALFGALVAGSVVAFNVLIPDGSDYARASSFKHSLLAASKDEKKIILVGGSNMSFGVDSNVIAEGTHCPVINMGMNGYFGVRFMLNEVKPYLRSGDVVVVAFEYDNFYKSADGTDTDLAMVTKANPAALRFLSPKQLAKVVRKHPYVAHQKLLRLMTDARYFAGRLNAPKTPPNPNEVDIARIESFQGFGDHGDLVGHLGFEWKSERENGIDLVNTPLDEQVIPMIAGFAKEEEALGVNVMMSFTPVIDYYFAAQKPEIERIDALYREQGLKVPRRSSEFVFKPSQHFDTVYHLNREGRAVRSAMLRDDILKQFGDAAVCNPKKTQEGTSP